MKKLLLFFVFIIGLTMAADCDKTVSKSENTFEKEWLRRVLPDSIYFKIENRPLIIHSYGHHGYSWTIISRIDTDYCAYVGRVHGDSEFVRPMSSKNKYSLAFFSTFAPLMSWGFDSLLSQVSKMEPLEGKTMFAGYSESLKLIDSCGKCVFESKNSQSFSGPDSVAFNKNIHALEFIMMWLSSPELQQTLPVKELIKSYRKTYKHMFE